MELLISQPGSSNYHHNGHSSKYDAGLHIKPGFIPPLSFSFSVQEQSEARREALETSQGAQQYYSDAQEAESWMKDREPLVSSGDYGKDEDSTQVSVRPEIWSLLC